MLATAASMPMTPATAVPAASATPTTPNMHSLDGFRALGKPDDVTFMIASMTQTRSEPDVFTKEVNACVTEDQKRHLVDLALAGQWN
jgi:hypothetical protein